MSDKYHADFNIVPNAIDYFTKEEILLVYQKMQESRSFETCIVALSSKKKFNIKVHMSSGQESVSAALAVAAPEYQYFIQHRSMDMFLAIGGDPKLLRDEISCKDSGCVGGKLGGGFQYHENGRDLYTHTGFIGENITVGVGAALGNGRKTVCLFGDGAAEEDYALTAYGFAATHKLPVLFVCTDNELSVLSPICKRRSWELADVSAGFGVSSVDITDDPFTIMYWIRKFKNNLPALINVRVCRNYWHAGLGIDGPPRWQRYEILRRQIKSLGWEKELNEIDNAAINRMEEVWKDYL